MAQLNYTGEEVNAKIVYYGPGVSGKTTNLECVHNKMPETARGEMVSMKTRTDRTLFFDFLPIELGDIGGYSTRFLLYTVPGQVYYNATRKLVLKGVDGIVFVADSGATKLEENVESLRNLEDNLNEIGLTLDDVPWVIQYNKRDVDDALPIEELHARLNLMNVPAYEAIASSGKGVYETFEGIAGLVMRVLREKLERGEVERATQEDPMKPSSHVGVGDSGEGADFSFDSAVDSALREVGESGGADGVYALADNNAEATTVAATKSTGVQAAGSSADIGVTKPAGSPPSNSNTPGGKTIFEEEHHDSEVGRTLELDDNETVAVEEEEPDDFITDPMGSRSSAPAVEEPETETVEALEPMSATERVIDVTDDETIDNPEVARADSEDVVVEEVVAEIAIENADVDVVDTDTDTEVPEGRAEPASGPAPVNPVEVTIPVTLKPSQLDGDRPLRLVLVISVASDGDGE